MRIWETLWTKVAAFLFFFPLMSTLAFVPASPFICFILSLLILHAYEIKWLSPDSLHMFSIPTPNRNSFQNFCEPGNDWSSWGSWAVGRADSLTNVSVNSNSNRVSYHFPVKQVFQPCWMIHSFSTIAIICHVSMPFHIHCSFYMNVPYQPAPNPLLLTIPSQPKHHHTDDTFSSHVLKMTSYILYILQLQLLTYCIKLYIICFLWAPLEQGFLFLIHLYIFSI